MWLLPWLSSGQVAADVLLSLGSGLRFKFQGFRSAVLHSSSVPCCRLSRCSPLEGGVAFIVLDSIRSGSETCHFFLPLFVAVSTYSWSAITPSHTPHSRPSMWPAVLALSVEDHTIQKCGSRSSHVRPQIICGSLMPLALCDV